MVLGVGRHSLATSRPRRRVRPTVALAGFLVPFATLFAVSGDVHPRAQFVEAVETVAAVETGAARSAEIVGLAQAGVEWAAVASTGPDIRSATEQLVVTASASRSMYRQVPTLLPAGVAPEKGLQIRTILAARAISAAFPEIHNIGGVRADALRWHPNGLAIDVMIPNYASAQGKALGDRIMKFAFANADRFALEHVIWQQTYYGRDGVGHRMANLGNDDANHYTHVHIATVGGGYPTGTEIYVR